MPQIVSNLPWLVIWVVVFLVQSYFFRKKNCFGSLILLWLTLLVGIFWDQALRALVPGIPEMWLFGTQIWILFLIVAVRHYLNYRPGCFRGQSARASYGTRRGGGDFGFVHENRRIKQAVRDCCVEAPHGLFLYGLEAINRSFAFLLSCLISHSRRIASVLLSKTSQ